MWSNSASNIFAAPRAAKMLSSILRYWNSISFSHRISVTLYICFYYNLCFESPCIRAGKISHLRYPMLMRICNYTPHSPTIFVEMFFHALSPLALHHELSLSLKLYCSVSSSLLLFLRFYLRLSRPPSFSSTLCCWLLPSLCPSFYPCIRFHFPLHLPVYLSLLIRISHPPCLYSSIASFFSPSVPLSLYPSVSLSLSSSIHPSLCASAL